MIGPARIAAFSILREIEQRGSHSDDLLNSRLVELLEERDRGLATEIVYGTLRWQGWLDYLLSRVVSRPLAKLEPGIRILLRLSLYQMCRTDRIPDHAIVHDAVELAKTHGRAGAAGLVNGVLRTLTSDRLWLREEVRHSCPPWDAVSLPQWLWERWARRYGTREAVDYALSLNVPPPLTCRLPPQEPREAYARPPFELSDLVPSALTIAGGVPTGDRAAGASLARQDEASQLVAYLAGPLAGRRIWDACAAPGGKSAILLELSAPGGWLVLSDRQFDRARRLLNRITPLNSKQVSSCDVVVLDAADPPPFRQGFDLVLVDAPCSGLGTLRRNPEIKWRITPRDLSRLGRLQRRILASAAAAVTRNGFLLYSTCSTEPEENEHVVTAFLEKNPSYRLVRPVSPKGVGRWIGPDRMVRTFPSLRLWDGFYAALLQSGGAG